MKTPNILTLLRIAVSPLFIIFFSIDTLWSFLVCIPIYIFMELSDYLDGQIARKNQQITDFGKLMDPFADSISRFSVFMSFLAAGLAPVWLIAVFFYRDVVVTVVRVFSIKEGIVVAARKSGKTKAWVQATCISIVMAILLLQKTSVLPSNLDIAPNVSIITVVIAVAAVITLWSAFDYWSGNKSVVLSSMRLNEADK